MAGEGIAEDERRHVFHSPVEQEVEPSHSAEGEHRGDSVQEILHVL
jgi:hypothetical protein